MKQPLLAAVALGLALAGPAQAQTYGDYYRSGYLLLGMYLRASIVCNNKAFVDYGFSLVGSNEFRAFTAAYPETYKKWMREGGENFNRGVMTDGIVAACKYMLAQMKRR